MVEVHIQDGAFVIADYWHKVCTIGRVTGHQSGGFLSKTGARELSHPKLSIHVECVDVRRINFNVVSFNI